MYLIQNVHVYAPEDLGIQDVLAGGGKILKVGEKLPVEKAYDITVIDGAGKVLMPGLIDSHVHILGGGGEGGARTRTGRIVARPGDTVEITEDDRLMVNGSVVSEGDIYFSTPAYDSDVTYPLTLGQDEYFILSDYREGAKDSRQFGPVQRNQIIGKVLTVLRRSGL